MKKLLLFIAILVSLSVFSQDTEYKEYSYTEFFELIEQETDTVFKLSNAIIDYNPQTDQEFKAVFSITKNTRSNTSINKVINKHIELNNVHFLSNFITEDGINYAEGALYRIQFKKNVILEEVSALTISHCLFEGRFIYAYQFGKRDQLGDLKERALPIFITQSSFDRFSFFKAGATLNNFSSNTVVTFNTFNTSYTSTSFSLGVIDFSRTTFIGNQINAKGSVYFVLESGTNGIEIKDNSIDSKHILFSINDIESATVIKQNQFSSKVSLSIDKLDKQDDVDWLQFKQNYFSNDAFISYFRNELEDNAIMNNLDSLEETRFYKTYQDSVRYHNKSAFVNEIALKGLFYDYYKSRYDTETANEVYLELKDFETERMKVRYQQNPNFKTFFTWKVNQFLKIFSAYGTQPARAIIFSLYVIIFFALIYLFFPNSWDSHGKNRIMDRYNFFFKYMKRKAGIHEVYLEDQNEELMSYEQFKSNISNSQQKVPKFFTATALPLYKWAISGTKLSASILKRIDIMKGTWSELPQSKRIWKSILLVSVFLIAVVYDIFIKMLNALMLSINTFTTLGFGEIPIKGLPRYLAIIQGFIGWFMLTIFSVSLISQLLN